MSQEPTIPHQQVPDNYTGPPEDPEEKTRRWVIPVVLLLVFMAVAAIGALAVLLLQPDPETTAETEEAVQQPPTATPVPATDLPDAPSNITAQTDNWLYDIPLNWNDNSDNEFGFHIYRRRLDILGAPSQAGETGVDEVAFIDQAVACGATYQYTVASWNNIGESPSSECWVVTVPACVPVGLARIGAGPQSGRNFVTGDLGETADFYLQIGTDGLMTFLADGSGMSGLITLGDTGAVSLHSVNLPGDPAWVRDGVRVIPGHTYIALARDGATLIVFRVVDAGNPTEIEYIVYNDDNALTVSQCPDMGGRTPGGPCISGDGVCDPTCVPDTGMTGQPVPPEVFDEPDDFDTFLSDLTHVESSGVFAGLLARLTPENNPDDPRLYITHVPDSVPEGTGNPGSRYPEPTYTERDEDCGSQPCISGDDICSPDCATDDPFREWEPDLTRVTTPQIAETYNDRDCGEPCVSGDGICDPTCDPNPNDPGRTPDDTGVRCIDSDGDGQVDDCYDVEEVQLGDASFTPDYGRGLWIREIQEDITCECDNTDLVCSDGTVLEGFPTCIGTVCDCEGTTLNCGGILFEDHHECDGQATQCTCTGTTLNCSDGTIVEDHPLCTGTPGTQPGIPSTVDQDCGGPCIEDNVCQPNCDPYFDEFGQYEEPNDPDCDGPCEEGDASCECLPTNLTHSLDYYDQCLPDCDCEGETYICRDVSGVVVSSTQNAPQCTEPTCACRGVDWVCLDAAGNEVSRITDYEQCSGPTSTPVCGCEGSSYVCRVDGTITTSTENADQCVTPACGCEGTSYVCRNPNTEAVISTTPDDNRCSEPASCVCQGNDYVCFDAAGNEISRAVEDLDNCGCTCQGPDVYCGTTGYVETNWAACGCFCDGTTLRCDGGYADENNAACTASTCTCVCTSTTSTPICQDSCTGVTCKP